MMVLQSFCPTDMNTKISLFHCVNGVHRSGDAATIAVYGSTEMTPHQAVRYVASLRSIRQVSAKDDKHCTVDVFLDQAGTEVKKLCTDEGLKSKMRQVVTQEYVRTVLLAPVAEESSAGAVPLRQNQAGAGNKRQREGGRESEEKKICRLTNEQLDKRDGQEQGDGQWQGGGGDDEVGADEVQLQGGDGGAEFLHAALQQLHFNMQGGDVPPAAFGPIPPALSKPPPAPLPLHIQGINASPAGAGTGAIVRMPKPKTQGAYRMSYGSAMALEEIFARAARRSRHSARVASMAAASLNEEAAILEDAGEVWRTILNEETARLNEEAAS